jgi:putative methionine-R-sulfoxide reductase with GAF domain
VIDQAPETNDDRLRRIRAITDAALSQLNGEALLQELLERVRDLIGTDTAAVALLDEDTQQLVTVAAIGLEVEVRQGFRLELGMGFAGRVVLTKAPVIIDIVDATTMNSPILGEASVRSLVAVPMLVGHELVGVLHLGTFLPRRFTEQDVTLLQLVADRAGLASRTRDTHADRATTLALQRSLLPSSFPTVQGVDLAARYAPGHHLGVGGDWYDVFNLPSGDLGVVVGDVSGHGLPAAVVMGRLRSALRAYALDEDDPATVLARLDRKITHFEAGNLATILYAMINPARDRMTVSVAGHLPPVLAVPDQEPCPLNLPVDLPVGVGAATTRRSTVVDLASDSTVVFYTDGLIERRAEIIDDGLRRLCATVRPGSAEAVCATIMENMGVDAADDDIALLVMRTQPMAPLPRHPADDA